MSELLPPLPLFPWIVGQWYRLSWRWNSDCGGPSTANLNEESMQREPHVLKNFGFSKKAQSTALNVSLDSTPYKKIFGSVSQLSWGPRIPQGHLYHCLYHSLLRWHLDILAWPWSALVSSQAGTTDSILEPFMPDSVLGMEQGLGKYLLT